MQLSRRTLIGSLVLTGILVSIFLFLVLTISASAQKAAIPDKIEQVLIHPPYGVSYGCSEHFQGTLEYVGDALGTDCLVSKLTRFDYGKRTFSVEYANDGRKNEDWFGWREPLLAPFDAEIVRVHINDKTNEPGIMIPGRASSIAFKRSDGVIVVYAHIQEPMVAVGDLVKAGQPVALTGNNGFSRSPHVHISAWRDDNIPLQIRHDLSKPVEFLYDKAEE